MEYPSKNKSIYCWSKVLWCLPDRKNTHNASRTKRVSKCQNRNIGQLLTFIFLFSNTLHNTIVPSRPTAGHIFQERNSKKIILTGKKHYLGIHRIEIQSLIRIFFLHGNTPGAVDTSDLYSVPDGEGSLAWCAAIGKFTEWSGPTATHHIDAPPFEVLKMHW